VSSQAERALGFRRTPRVATTIDYGFQFQSDGRVSITTSDGSALAPVPLERLRRVLTPRGFRIEDRDDVIRQLVKTGLATKRIPSSTKT